MSTVVDSSVLSVKNIEVTPFDCDFRGSWHGDVAIKMLNMDPDTDNQAQLQNFKMEVST